jgi:hypothetical protein
VLARAAHDQTVGHGTSFGLVTGGSVAVLWRARPC